MVQSCQLHHTFASQACLQWQPRWWSGLHRRVVQRLLLSIRYRLEFRSEFFNLTNSFHFGELNVAVNVTQAGRITGTGIPNRQIEFASRSLF